MFNLLTYQGKGEEKIVSLAVRNIGLFLCSYEPKLEAEIFNRNILQYSINLIDHNCAGIRREICWALATILARSPKAIQECIDCKLVKNLIFKMTKDSDPKVRSEAITAISNALYKAEPE